MSSMNRSEYKCCLHFSRNEELSCDTVHFSRNEQFSGDAGESTETTIALKPCFSASRTCFMVKSRFYQIKKLCANDLLKIKQCIIWGTYFENKNLQPIHGLFSSFDFCNGGSRPNTQYVACIQTSSSCEFLRIYIHMLTTTRNNRTLPTFCNSNFATTVNNFVESCGCDTNRKSYFRSQNCCWNIDIGHVIQHLGTKTDSITNKKAL